MDKVDAIKLLGCLRLALDKLEDFVDIVNKLDDSDEKEYLLKVSAQLMGDVIADAVCPIESLFPELDPYN